MKKPAIELSVLYEIASLPYNTTEENIKELVMQKIIRLFPIKQCAIILNSDKKPLTYGFKKGSKINQITNKENKRTFKYQLKNSKAIGLLFAEKTSAFTEKERKFLILLAERLNEILLLIRAEKLNNESEHIQEIFKTIPDPIVIVDKNNKIIEGNELLLKLTNLKKNKILSKSLHDLQIFTDNSKKKLNEKFYFENNKQTEVEVILNHKRKFYEINTNTAEINGKKVYLLIFHDITKRKEMDQIKSEFISITSHQLRTPVSAVKWLCELLMKGRVGKLSHDQLNLFENIYNSNERMIKLIDDLLDVSMIQNNKIKMNKTNFDVKKFVEDLIKDFTKIFDKKKVEIWINPAAKKVFLFADRNKIRQIFDNLIDNAIKYSKGKAIIKINWLEKGKNIKFTISDNGIGIPKYDQNRIFDAFYKTENSLNINQTRVGLGLFAVKTIIDASEGKIWLDSKVGKGTTFHFTLPIT
jgi:PAS domain S-box-containing protein